MRPEVSANQLEVRELQRGLVHPNLAQQQHGVESYLVDQLGVLLATSWQLQTPSGRGYLSRRRRLGDSWLAAP